MISLNLNKTGSILTFTILLFASLLSQKVSNVIKQNNAPNINFFNFPSQLGDWKGEETLGLDKQSLDTLQLSSYVKRIYKNQKTGQTVFLYMGYWANQTGEHQAAKHSPSLCLPSNGWLVNHLDSIILPSKKYGSLSDITVRRVIGEKSRNKDLFYYWFFAGKDYYSIEWYALVKLSLENILFGRSDGGIVEISSQIVGSGQTKAEIEKSEKNIQEFLEHLIPYLDNQLNAN